MVNKKAGSIRSKDHGPRAVDARGFVSLVVPDPPGGVRGWIVDWWVGFFDSDLARMVYKDTDLPALTRLANLYEVRDMSMEFGMLDPLVAGGNGQVAEHPMLRALARYDSAIDRLEDRFGLTPRARLNLGLQLVSATKQLEDLSDPGVVEGPDPRDVVDV